MKSTSFSVHTIKELENQIIETQRNKFNPTLGIVFGSVDCDLFDIPDLFNLYNIDVVGCSSAGEISNQNVFEKTMTVMLMDINKDFYSIKVSHDKNGDFQKLGTELGVYGKSFCEFPAFLTFMNMTMNAEGIIEGIKSVVTEKTKIFGGVAGDDFRMIKTYTITNEGCTEGAIATLIFDQNKVEINGRALCGWQSIGTQNEVTHAEGNIVYSINNKPAVEVFEGYFGSFHDNNEFETNVVEVGASQYPFQIARGDNMVLRAPLKVLEDQSILMAGPVHTGDKFKFSVAPGFEIIEETIQGFRDYQNDCPNADALLLISCKARHMSLGPMVEEEIKGIQNVWGKPLIGFFSYGELGLSEDGECLFYNDTCSLVLIREKE